MKPPQTLYRGRRVFGVNGEPIGVLVTVNARALTPKRALKINKRNQEGFDWGYRGAGPAQLAFALILDATDKPFAAINYHQQFKRHVVAEWCGDVWAITATEIREWVNRFEVEKMEDLDRQAAASQPSERACRVCGCTEADFSRCIEAQGFPCCWVAGERNLCSRCDADFDVAVLAKKGGAK